MLLTDRDEKPSDYREDLEHPDLYEIRVERLWRLYMAGRGPGAIAEEAAGVMVAITGSKWRALAFFINTVDLAWPLQALVFVLFVIAATIAFWAGVKA